MTGGFFVGLHQVSDAKYFQRACISINRLKNRRYPFAVREWIMDSGAFTLLSTHGGFPESTMEYAYQVERWSTNGRMLAAVTQDYMCEPFMLAKTGLTVSQHQKLTIERYQDLRELIDPSIHLMPVLQGYEPQEYVRHIKNYRDLLLPGMWVGVGSVCKRNGTPKSLIQVLHAIKSERPDLRLHGFGLKITALQSSARDYLHSADSMAWSFRARKPGRNQNDWREAYEFCQEIDGLSATI